MFPFPRVYIRSDPNRDVHSDLFSVFILFFFHPGRLAQIIILMFTVAIFFTYALQFYVPIEIMLPHLEARFPGRGLLVNYGLRYAVVLLTCEQFPCLIRL